ncbi:PAS domain S-box protein [Scytonema tolypothrichoides VB-61278]|nr:PAS domain S-box protein [Scytonema tolypothrichoides VB-61278]
MCDGSEIAKVNQQLALALSAAKMVTWNWDLLNNRVIWSSSDEQLFGIAPGTFPETYEAAIALVHPHDQEAVILALNQARVRKNDFRQELRFFGSDGRMYWIEAKGRFFYNDLGIAVRMLGTIMEIGDRKAKESQLRLLESVVVNTNDAVIITQAQPVDPPGPEIIYVNPAFTQMTGYTLEEVLGKTPRILQGEKTDRATLDEIRTAMQNWQSVQVDLINYTKDGDEIWVEISIFPIKDETGWYTHWVSVQRDITERKQAEVVLKESEERFRQIAENIQDVFYVSDYTTDQIVYVSPAYEKIWGRTRESLYANWRDWMNAIHPDDTQRVQAVNLEAVFQGEEFNADYRIVRPDGTVRWIQDRGFQLKDEFGQIQRLIGIAQDITDKKLVEIALEHSEERFRQIAENIHDVVWMSDRKSHQILYVSPAYERIWGRTCESLYTNGLDWLNGIHPEDQERTYALYIDLCQNTLPDTYDTEYRVVCPDGTLRWIRDRGFQVKDEFGQIQRLIGIAQDITEHKFAEVALRESEERFRQIAENIEDVFWALDFVKEQLIYVSPAYERIWGRKCENLYGSWNDWVDSLHPDDKEIVVATFRQRMHQGFEHEYRILRPDGTVRWIRDRAFPVMDEFGQLQRIIGIAQDITEHKLAEVALVESEERFRQLAENIQDVFWISNSEDQQLLYVSPAYERIWRRKCENLYGGWNDWIDSLHPDDSERTLAIFREVHQVQMEYEYRIVRLDGTIRWIRDRAFPLKDEFGQLQRVIGIAEDITEHKLAEVALRESEERFRQIAENIEDVFWALDFVNQRLLYVSPAYERIWGRKRESLYTSSKDWMDSLHPDDKQTVLATVREKAYQEQFEHEYRIVRLDGTVRWIRDRGFPIKNEFGQLQRVIGIAEDITEAKLAEVALRESEERFRQIAENIEDVFWVVDFVTQQVIYVSPGYERIWGRKCESLYADRTEWVDSLYPDDREKVLATFNEKAHQGFEREFRIVRPDGTVRWIGDRGVPVKDEFGQVQRIIGIGQDITERKLAEAALEQLNEELELRVQQRTLELEHSQAILQQQVEREQLITHLTQQIRQSLDLATILNNVVLEVQKLLAADRVLVYQMQPDKTGRIVAEAVVKEESIRILDRLFPQETFPEQCRQRYLQGEVYILTDLKSAQTIPCVADFLAEIQVRAELVVPIIQKQAIWGLLIVHQCHQPREWQTWEIDLLKQLTSQMAIAIQQSQLYQQLRKELHERLRIELELRRSENLFRSLSELAPVGIFKGDAQGQMIYTNPRCQAICGFTFKEALGYGWTEFIHPEDRQLSQLQWSALSTHTEFSQEMRFVHRDGTIRFTRVIVVLIFSESGELVGHVGTVEDITESQAIEKMKQEFISIVSHELRTPLAAIRGSLGLLAAGVLKNQPETSQQMLEIAASDTERLVRLVNDILDLERLEANKIFLVKRWCDADALMRQSVETMRALAVENNITLCIIPSSVQVWADPDQILQTLVNLVSNAIKFSSSETTVTLSVQALSDHVVFQIQDQGRGIPHDQLESIFGRFQQVDASDSRQKGGTGLGLAICRSIIQQHGGRIWAESVLGKGSVFYFTLPQRPQNNANA